MVCFEKHEIWVFFKANQIRGA